ncbi:MAG: hypothetical protein ACLFUJ_04630 [Phycisphaerae bacterium]
MPPQSDNQQPFLPDVQSMLDRSARRRKQRRARSVRHGDWLFEPADQLRVHDWMIELDQPLAADEPEAGRAEKISRSGGEIVYVGPDYPLGISEATYRKLLADDPTIAAQPWRSARIYGTLYVCGRIDLPGLVPLQLEGWHRAIRQAPRRVDTATAAPRPA